MLFINSLYKYVLATQYVVLKTKPTLMHRYRNVFVMQKRHFSGEKIILCSVKKPHLETDLSKTKKNTDFIKWFEYLFFFLLSSKNSAYD